MKKESLAKFLNNDIGDFEIVNIGYGGIGERVDLLLQEFMWCGDGRSLDHKKFLNCFKKLKILDCFAFTYYEDDNLVNSLEEYVKRNNGFNENHLLLMIESPALVFTTEVQKDWIKILQRFNWFDEDEFKKQFMVEFKKALIKFYKDSPMKEEIIKYVKFFNEIGNGLNK